MVWQFFLYGFVVISLFVTCLLLNSSTMSTTLDELMCSVLTLFYICNMLAFSVMSWRNV